MSDLLKREFSAQLANVMDLIQRRAIFEIMKIFENSLFDHQKELELKGEEIAQLKMQLRRKEIKQSNLGGGSDGETQTTITETNTTHTEIEDDVSAVGQTSDVPEINFEVPDDWCAPVGSEKVTKQCENECPSVRLRRLTIPLWHVQIKQEVMVTCDINSQQGTKDESRLKAGRGSTKAQLPLPQHVKGPTLRKHMKQHCQDVKTEYTDQTGCRALRGRGRDLIEKEEKGVVERKNEATASESTQQVIEGTENELQEYSCKFCKKAFDTEFGKSVHERMHNNCKGCKRVFNLSSVLQRHKASCVKYKRFLAKRARQENQTAVKRERRCSSSNPTEAPNETDQSAQNQTCAFCNKRVSSRYYLKEHMRVHTGEKPFLCTMCPKRFRVNQSLKRHMLNRHKDQKGVFEEINGDLAWTMPLEIIEDNQEYSEDTSQAVQKKKTPKNGSWERWPDLRGWQQKGTRCSKGFTCLICQKLVRTKWVLIEHYRTHTGEKPLKCKFCPARFRFSTQLKLHQKKCRQSTIQCEKCGMKFPSKAKYQSHLRRDHKDFTIFCNVCGKGFFRKGHLKNHMLLHN